MARAWLADFLSYIPVKFSNSVILCWQFERMQTHWKKKKKKKECYALKVHPLGPLSPTDGAFFIYRFHVRLFSWWLWLWDIPRQLLRQNPNRKQQLGVSGKLLFYLGTVACSWGNLHGKQPLAGEVRWQGHSTSETCRRDIVCGYFSK